ncbi:SCO4848 family membrane protein [Actinokineospora sp.]|uniref:SCO4848 family membrane protein n=1 Tax=Actinokineospora sp. TaxID=1872133 RepID=UPI0040376EB4
MPLSRRACLFLLAFALWSWVSWPMFLRDSWADDHSWAAGGGPTTFVVVHAVLTAASLVFGTVIGVIGWRGLAAARGRT